MVCKNQALLDVYNEVLKDMVDIGIKPGRVDKLAGSNRYTVCNGMWQRHKDDTVSITIYLRNLPGPGSYSFRNVVAHEMLHAAANDLEGKNVLHSGLWLEFAKKMNSAYPDKYSIQEDEILNSQTIEEYQYFALCTKCGEIGLFMDEKMYDDHIAHYECECYGKFIGISKDEARDIVMHPEKKPEYIKIFRRRLQEQRIQKAGIA